ncbi:hypothetical protein COV13_02340 [Candidatus Woesearchaeota archaeon CG10_big_fil_rev_8_21_14_0_10_32_9]|nr:MAG: hypothetical protein COV13_02340 [Candidatus Woesearchaeota archaeon CG10_big_fil_rev_8_21_14_0_10_32_9]
MDERNQIFGLSEENRVQQRSDNKEHNFTNLNSYKEIFPIVVKTLKTLENAHHHTYQSLIDESRKVSAEILSKLAEGYNKYHPEEKAKNYSQARTNISKLQSNLNILHALQIIENVQDIIQEYNEKMKSLNGLIKSMEIK